MPVRNPDHPGDPGGQEIRGTDMRRKIDPGLTIEGLREIHSHANFMKENKINENAANFIQLVCEHAIELIEMAIQKGKERSSCPFCGSAGIEWQLWIPPGAELGYYYGFCDICGTKIRYKEEDLLNAKDTLEETVPREVQRYGSD